MPGSSRILNSRQVRQPPVDLTLVEPVGLPEALQPPRPPVDRRQLARSRRRAGTRAPPRAARSSVERRRPLVPHAHRRPAVDVAHQVEGSRRARSRRRTPRSPPGVARRCRSAPRAPGTRAASSRCGPSGTSRGGRRSTIRWSPRRTSKISFDDAAADERRLDRLARTRQPVLVHPTRPSAVVVDEPLGAGFRRRCLRLPRRRSVAVTGSRPRARAGRRSAAAPLPDASRQVRAREQALVRLVPLQHLAGDRHLVHLGRAVGDAHHRHRQPTCPRAASRSTRRARRGCASPGTRRRAAPSASPPSRPRSRCGALCPPTWSIVHAACSTCSRNCCSWIHESAIVVLHHLLLRQHLALGRRGSAPARTSCRTPAGTSRSCASRGGCARRRAASARSRTPGPRRRAGSRPARARCRSARTRASPRPRARPPSPTLRMMLMPGRVRRHQEHRRALVHGHVRVGHRHHDRERRVPEVRREPLLAVDHPLVAVALGPALELLRVGRPPAARSSSSRTRSAPSSSGWRYFSFCSSVP